MGYANPRKTFTVKLAEWHPDSFWTLRAQKGDADDEKIEDLTRKVIIRDIPEEEIRRTKGSRKAINQLASKYASQEVVMSVKRAALLHMTVAWGGPDFVLPADWSEEDDETGNPITHELAGQLPPVEEHWIAVRDDTDEVYDLCTEQWAGRSAEEQKTF